MRWISISPVAEIPEGKSQVYEIGNSLWIAVCRVEGEVFAVEDMCPHDTGPLGEGCLEGHEIICPRHGARFDIRSGKVKCLPALVDIRSFPTREIDGQIQVGIGA